MLQTVKENKTFFTNRQIERAKAARQLSRAIGCPSDADFKAILKMNTIKDCPIVEADIELAQKKIREAGLPSILSERLAKGA